MPAEMASDGLTLAQACQYLELSFDDFTNLRQQGLIAYIFQDGRQIYPRTALEITSQLLSLARSRDWNMGTLAWYVDLLFAAEIGRAILLPIHEGKSPRPSNPTNWLETSYAASVLDELRQGEDRADAAISTPLCSLVAVAVGEGQFWANAESLEQSALYPIIALLEKTGIPIIDQGPSIARDAGTNFAAMMFGFIYLAPPISDELGQLVSTAQKTLKSVTAIQVNTPLDEQDIIRRQPLIPVDALYVSKATEIHSPPEIWDFKLGILRAERRTIAVQVKLPLDADKPFIDNIIDMIRPFVGSFGARAVHLLYEIANDPPYYRNPVITVDTNKMLDRLGLKRDKNGFHRSKNRERLRDALNAAHALEIVGEYTTWENGKTVVKAFYRTVLSLIGATFDPAERKGIPTTELRTRGLPKTMQIRLNFYDGIRRPDGKLGNHYVLTPRLAEPNKLPSAKYSKTQELLKAYLLFRYRQTRMTSRILTVTRRTALEKANITTKNVTWATQTLTKALEKLVEEGTLEDFSPVPHKEQEAFTVVLSERMVADHAVPDRTSN